MKQKRVAPIIRYWKDKDTGDKYQKDLFKQLEDIIADVRDYVSFERATKSYDKGCNSDKRFYKGKKWLDCYRECLDINEESDNADELMDDIYRKYDLPKYLREDYNLILETTNVIFYLKVIEAQGLFIKNNISKIKQLSDDKPHALNMGACWLIQRIYPKEFSEVFRGSVDSDKPADDRAKSDMKAALDSMKARIKQTGTTKLTDYKLAKIQDKIENGARIKQDD